MAEPVSFKALVVEEKEEKVFTRTVAERSLGDLPPGDVLINVLYSSLNYKDALSASGNKGVTRKYPHTPGIDAAGVVVQSESKDFQPGNEVIATSYDIGMNTPGGFGQYIRIPAKWVVPLPQGMTLRESMLFGTAGFTAALSVYKLERGGVLPDAGHILVSGATGGVGGIAVAILSKIGYRVTAVNGLEDRTDYLKGIGAHEVIEIGDVTDQSGRPMLKGLWAGAVDAVGGPILATTVKSVKPGGVVTCCGNIASPELNLTVYPFIIRGVSLIGINSQSCPMPLRRKIWERLSGEWKVNNMHTMVSEVSLNDLSQRIEDMLQRKRKGRTLVDLRE